MKLLRFSENVAGGDERDEEIPAPEIPESATAREVGIVLIQVVASLRNQFIRANRARDRREKRRFWMLAGTIAGLVIDVFLSFVAFGLISSNHALTVQVQHQQTTITGQQAEIHDEQLVSCQNSNMTRATAKSVWFGVLDQFNTPGVPASTRAFAQQAEARIAKAYQQVDCSKVFRK